MADLDGARAGTGGSAPGGDRVRPAARLAPVRRSPGSSAPSGGAGRDDTGPIGPEGGQVGDSVQTGIDQARGGGSPITPDVRAPLERSFGADFSRVRIHTGGRADGLNRSLQSRAFTTGSDVFFRQGEYRPGTNDGRHLLAHELTHVVQNTGKLDLQRDTIHRWFGRSKKKKKEERDSGPVIGGPMNVTGVDATLSQYSAGSVRQLVPRDAPTEDKKVENGARGFVLDQFGRMTTYAEAVSVAEGQMVAVLVGSGGALRQARDTEGKPISYYHCRIGGKDVAVPDAAFKAEGKAMKRIGKAGGVAGWLASGTEGVGTAVSDFSKANAKQTASTSAAANPGVFSGGEMVGYDSLGSTQQGIYDNANYYNATQDAVTGSAAALGSWFGFISDMKGFYDNWSSMNKKERANAIADGFASFAGTFASTADAVAHTLISTGNAGDTRSFGMRSVKVAGSNGDLVKGKEWYQATKGEEVSIGASMIAGGVGAAKEVKDAILNFVKWCKHLRKADQHGNLAREGVNTLQSFGTAAKSTLSTVMQVKEFFEGAAGVAAQAMPIFGLVLNALEIVKRGMDIWRAYKDAKLVKKDKASAKKRFRERYGQKVDHKIMRLKRKRLETRLGQLDEGDPEAVQIESEIEEIDEYLLDRDLANTANKRRNRAILAIIKEAQSVAGNIATLAGQLHVAAGFKISGTATGLGAIGVRKVKQFGRDHGWKGFNKNKTTEKKNARYAEIADRLYGDFIDVNLRFRDHLFHAGASMKINTAKEFDKELSAHISAGRRGTVRNLTKIQQDNAKLKGRVKAAGLSWREFCAEKDPTKRYQMLIDGQKKRE